MIIKTKSIEERKQAIAEIKARYESVKVGLTERGRRLFAGSEALTFGFGGITAVSRATGLSLTVVRRGLQECEQIEAGEKPTLTPQQSRQPGGGRKKLTEKMPELLPTLKEIVEATTRGDPQSPLLWTARSLRNIQNALKEKGYETSFKSVSRLLTELGYSLQANKKRWEGRQHPDRNAQFEHINETVRQQLEVGEPVISVDAKKKELVGDYKNAGRELRPKGQPEEVNAYDFVDKELGKVTPYGVYDLAENEAWVSVGINHDTAEFAVGTIRQWYKNLGQELYPNATSLLITADCGGSNGYRLRLWKVELQKLVNELQFPITVCHLPPGTSKWNKIEHRLFSFMTQNWRAKPLISHQVILELIAATTTKTGLKVYSWLDQNDYQTGRRVSDHELAQVNIVPDAWHGEWNYTIHPNTENECI